MHAAVAAQRTPTVVSQQSAALLLGLPLWNVDLTRAQLTQSRAGAGRKTEHLHVHATPADSVPAVQIGGLTMTDPARTVFDIACTVGFEEAVVVADAALKRPLTHRTHSSQWPPEYTGTWGDLTRPDRLYPRIRASLDRAGRLHHG